MNKLITQPTQKEITNSLSLLFKEYNEKLESLEKISSYVHEKDELLVYFLSGNRVKDFMAKEIFSLSGAVNSLNSEFWNRAMQLTDVLDFMPAKLRNEWSSMIYELKTPDFKESDVISTIQELLMNRQKFFSEKVDGIFKSLSKNHITNSPSGFRERMIISSVIGSYGQVNHYVVEYLQDLRQVIAKINKQDVSKINRIYYDIDYIYCSKNFGEWFSFDGGAFKMKIFKNGNAHLEINESIAFELNSILSFLYPSAIPDVHRKPSKKIKSFILTKDYLNYEDRSLLVNIVDNFRKDNRSFIYKSSLNEKIISILTKIGGTCKSQKKEVQEWEFPYYVYNVMKEIIRSGEVPNLKNYQFYPTPKVISDYLFNLIEVNDNDLILEPSAGRGDLVSDFNKSKVTCIEIDPINVRILKEKGFNVLEKDFLSFESNLKFDKIIMNPPFSEGRAELHVKHALSFLKDSGELFAILPTSFKNKKLDDNYHQELIETFKNEFHDTTISVCIMKFYK